ncbi:hypothetical protein, partial [Leeuwenhoekiella sp. CH_XMU1409-2]
MKTKLQILRKSTFHKVHFLAFLLLFSSMATSANTKNQVVDEVFVTTRLQDASLKETFETIEA